MEMNVAEYKRNLVTKLVDFRRKYVSSTISYDYFARDETHNVPPQAHRADCE